MKRWQIGTTAVIAFILVLLVYMMIIVPSRYDKISIIQPVSGKQPSVHLKGTIVKTQTTVDGKSGTYVLYWLDDGSGEKALISAPLEWIANYQQDFWSAYGNYTANFDLHVGQVWIFSATVQVLQDYQTIYFYGAHVSARVVITPTDYHKASWWE